MRTELVGLEVQASGNGTSTGDVESLIGEGQVALGCEILERANCVRGSDGRGTGEFGWLAGGEVDGAKEGAFEWPDSRGEADEMTIEYRATPDGPARNQDLLVYMILGLM